MAIQDDVMSIRAMVWALDAAVPDMKAKLVLIALADHADDETFQCWPSAKHIAKRLGIHRASVYRAVIYLAENGFITHQKRDWPNRSGRQPLFTLLVAPPVAISDTLSQSSATTPSHCSDSNEPSLNRHKERGGRGIKEEGFLAPPHSPEFVSWKSHYTDIKKLSMVRELSKRELEGRAFNFESQWPPN